MKKLLIILTLVILPAALWAGKPVQNIGEEIRAKGIGTSPIFRP